jgi:phosphatidylglycerophosphatase A
MDHESCRCDKLRRKGDIKRFIDELTETEEADNKELGIDVVLGLWFRQNRNL